MILECEVFMMKIVKYMSLMQFMSICESKKMFLSRIDRWDDKREAVMLQVLVQKTKLDANMEKELCKCIPSLLYAQSWYSVCDESELMWRAYARDNGPLGYKKSVSLCLG